MLYSDCFVSEDQKIISIGASIFIEGTNISTGDLTTGGKLKIIVGKRDQFNYDANKILFKRIKARNGNVEWTELDSAHEIPEEVLLQTLK